jgi:DNA-binding XRE family transcriptional regulator
MTRPVRTKTPSGEDIVLLPLAEYERLRELAEDTYDSLVAERALAELAGGGVELISHGDVAALLAAPSPVSFWRKRRGLTQAALAKAARISQAYLAQIEKGSRKGDVTLYQRLAETLRVDIEDLLPLKAAKSKTTQAKK